jgi:phosphoglycolate phosphatase-like HAD superfamily hydrolase
MLMPFCAGHFYLDAVAFDLDGTLIESIDVYVRLLNTALRRIGVAEAPRDQVLAAIREGGFDWSQVLTDVRGRRRDEIIQKAMAVISGMYQDIFTRVDIRAGKAAGTMTVGVLTGVDDYESLKAEDPDAIMDSVAALKDLFAHSSLIC